MRYQTYLPHHFCLHHARTYSCIFQSVAVVSSGLYLPSDSYVLASIVFTIVAYTKGGKCNFFVIVLCLCHFAFVPTYCRKLAALSIPDADMLDMWESPYGDYSVFDCTPSPFSAVDQSLSLVTLHSHLNTDAYVQVHRSMCTSCLVVLPLHLPATCLMVDSVVRIFAL